MESSQTSNNRTRLGTIGVMRAPISQLPGMHIVRPGHVHWARRSGVIVALNVLQ
jgi:hypothetical protein